MHPPTLTSFRLFASLPRDALVAIAAATELIEFVPGAMIIVRDERAFALYAIVNGTVRRSEETGDALRLAELNVVLDTMESSMLAERSSGGQR